MSRAERRRARRETLKTGLLEMPRVVEKIQDIPWSPLVKTPLAPGEMEKLTLNGQRNFIAGYINSRYQILMFEACCTPEWPEMVWLSIRRQDRQPIRDWRDIQRIKNELFGPENEAVELYPAESRLMDTSNQYHVFVLKDPKIRFPFGVGDRLVLTPEQLANAKDFDSSGAKQRGFET